MFGLGYEVRDYKSMQTLAIDVKRSECNNEATTTVYKTSLAATLVSIDLSTRMISVNEILVLAKKGSGGCRAAVCSTPALVVK